MKSNVLLLPNSSIWDNEWSHTCGIPAVKQWALDHLLMIFFSCALIQKNSSHEQMNEQKKKIFHNVPVEHWVYVTELKLSFCLFLEQYSEYHIFEQVTLNKNKEEKREPCLFFIKCREKTKTLSLWKGLRTLTSTFTFIFGCARP